MKNKGNETGITRIYLVENCYGNLNKVYIGKTKGNRRSHHEITFGDQIEYNYIDEIQSLNKKDWKPLEGFWIEYFKFLGFEVLNKNNGGGGPSYWNEEQILKAKERASKRKWNGRTTIEIIQFDKQNNFIKEWNSIKEAGEFFEIDSGTLIACLKGKQKTCKGYIWKYKNPKQAFKKYLTKNRTKDQIDKMLKPIIQYDLKMNFIKEWSSIKEASINLNITTGYITNSIKNNKSAKNFIFKYL